MDSATEPRPSVVHTHCNQPPAQEVDYSAAAALSPVLTCGVREGDVGLLGYAA